MMERKKRERKRRKKRATRYNLSKREATKQKRKQREKKNQAVTFLHCSFCPRFLICTRNYNVPGRQFVLHALCLRGEEAR